MRTGLNADNHYSLLTKSQSNQIMQINCQFTAKDSQRKKTSRGVRVAIFGNAPNLEYGHITNAPVPVHTQLIMMILQQLVCPQPSGAHKTNCSVVTQDN